MAENNDILNSIAAQIARNEAEIRAKQAELEGLRQAENAIRVARGTGVAVPEAPALPPAIERRAEPRGARVSRGARGTSVTAGGITAAPLPAIAASPSLVERVRATLDLHSMTTLQLAGAIGTTPDLMQGTLDALQRAGQVYRFTDGAYAWKVGNASSDMLTALIKRYMLERHVSRRDLMQAIGVEDKLLEKRVDNQLDYVRETEPVWGQKDDEGHWLYWIVPGQKPPRELDGRKAKRVRGRTAAQSPRPDARKQTRTSRHKPRS